MMLLSLDDLVRCVVMLRSPQGTVGSGFLITNGQRLFVVTAAHVASSINDDGYLVFHGGGDVPVDVPMGHLMFTGRVRWRFHPDADVAAIEIFNNSNHFAADFFNGRFLPLEVISFDEMAPDKTTTLTSIGFPLGLGVGGHFSPLIFESRPASGLLTLRRADTGTPQTFFVLQNPSVGGYSGCLVVDTSIVHAGNMVSTGGGIKVHGVMHGTISDDTGGKIAMVTPAFYIKSLLGDLGVGV